MSKRQVFFTVQAAVVCFSLTVLASNLHANAVEITDSTVALNSSLDQDLFRAARDGTVREIESLIQAGADVDARTDTGVTALMVAAVVNPNTEAITESSPSRFELQRLNTASPIIEVRRAEGSMKECATDIAKSLWERAVP